MRINQKDINLVLEDDNWTSMNKILYQMCSEHPEHTDTSIVMAKYALSGDTIRLQLKEER